MRNLVLISPAANVRVRDALSRALQRFPAAVEETPLETRAAALVRAAAGEDVEWILVLDDDAVLNADAFGSVRRAAQPGAALIGGRALVGESQRLGSMFAPLHSGPNPFELTQITGLQTDRHLADLVRGRIDAPQRGAYLVAASFARSLDAAALDSAVLHLDLAVHARAAGQSVVCEPLLTFTAEEDPIELRRRLGNLRRYRSVGTWQSNLLHRDPRALHASFVTREVRSMGSIRGYARQPYPPCEVIAVAGDEMARARANRRSGEIPNRAAVTVCSAADGAVVRSALARTSDRYLLVSPADALPDKTGYEALAEQLERSGRVAAALHDRNDPNGAVLFHCGRIVGAGDLSGASVADVVSAALAALPSRRLFAADAGGEIVPAELRPLETVPKLDLVFVAASKPAVTDQSIRSMLGEAIGGTFYALYPAGSATTEKLLQVHSIVQLRPDASDVQLAVGLNRVLAECTADVIAIVRDDVQIPHGTLARLQDAFRRIVRLGAAVPRIGGTDRPESIPDLGYRDSAEMQSLADRRAEAHAREALLLDFATAPVIAISREALHAVGGFDERYGFSRIGVEDFSRRLRSANYLVARCDDAYAHAFSWDDSGSFIANLDEAPFLRAAYQKRWSQPHGFDPERDRLPLRGREAATPSAPAPVDRLRILVPLSSEEEWLRAQPVIVEFAAAFRSGDPLDVAIGLDGTFGLHAAVAAVRELLTSAGVPMEETLNVSIDFIADIAAWRGDAPRTVRLTGLDRSGLESVDTIDGVAAVRTALGADAK